MRKSPILDALFPELRQQILAATLLSPEKSWYLSELAAHVLENGGDRSSSEN